MLRTIERMTASGSRNLSRPTLLALALAVLGLALMLSACGSDASTTDAPSALSDTEHNDADVAFATDMIQHHAQALSMVDLTVARTLDPEVQQLAEDVRAALGPEIETMSDWLQEWDEEVPETMRDHSNAGHDMEGMADSLEGMESDMPGTMTADDFNELENAPDPDFQALWLEKMVEHHQGTIEMAEDQQAGGQYRPAVELAGTIVDTQTAEIETMQELLGP